MSRSGARRAQRLRAPQPLLLLSPLSASPLLSPCEVRARHARAFPSSEAPV